MPEYSPRFFDGCVEYLESGKSHPQINPHEVAKTLRVLATARHKAKKRLTQKELAELDRAILQVAQAVAGPMVYPMGDDIGIEGIEAPKSEE